MCGTLQVLPLSSSSGRAKDQTCSTRRQDGRRACQHTCVHAVAGLPCEYRCIAPRHRNLR
eukprot:2314384-Pyramimonas_sp.AAC.1